MLAQLPKEADMTADGEEKAAPGGVSHKGKTDARKHENDVEEFMQDLEADKEMRKEISIWRDPRYCFADTLSRRYGQLKCKSPDY